MTQYYKDYFWKEGRPRGRDCLGSSPAAEGSCYRIIADPYFKRISIEEYRDGTFKVSLYDSYLLDFRHFKKPEHTAWQRTALFENQDQATSIIRNQDDRVVFKEEIFFEKGVCKACRIYSPHGVFLSLHQMHYQSQGDAFNGVMLFDATMRPVMKKIYDIDPLSGEFTTLTEESWSLGLVAAGETLGRAVNSE